MSQVARIIENWSSTQYIAKGTTSFGAVGQDGSRLFDPQLLSLGAFLL
jgi:hypothetical protein